MNFINTGVKLDFLVCEASKLRNRPITNGNFYLTKDEREIYVDWDGVRTLMNSIVYAPTYVDLCNIPNRNTNKIYWEYETNSGYMYINDTLTKVITPSQEMENLILDAFHVGWVDSYEELEGLVEPNDHVLYCVPFTPADGSTHEVEYQQYLYNSTSGTFERIALNYDEVSDISYNVVNESITELEAEIASIKDALIAGTLQDPSEYFEAISAFYQDVYKKNEVYTDDEVDTLLLANKNESTALINSTWEAIKVSSFPYIQSINADEAGIVVDRERAFYTLDTTVRNVVDFTVEPNLPDGTVISVEVLLTGCQTVAPTFNPNPTWVDNYVPTYDNDNVLLGFKSFDKGTTWIGFYQGSW